MRPGPFDAHAERLDLEGGAWVELHRSWVQEADDLFDRLLASVPWQADRRVMYDRVVDVPRLTARYEAGDPLPDGDVASIRDKLRARYMGEPGGDLRSTGMCLYRDGRDSVAWHGDRLGRAAHLDVVVAIVSLGASRSFLLRPRGGRTVHQLLLGGGDLIAMGGSCQRTWEHCVPKTRRPMGARISLQFRPAGVR